MAPHQNSYVSWQREACAYKYYDKIKGVLGVDVLREDEMECLIIGKAVVNT